MIHNKLTYFWDKIEAGQDLCDIFRFFDYRPEFCFPDLSAHQYESLGFQVLNKVGIKKKKIKYVYIDTAHPGSYRIDFSIDRTRTLSVTYLDDKPNKGIPTLYFINLIYLFKEHWYTLQRPITDPKMLWWCKETMVLKEIPYDP